MHTRSKGKIGEDISCIFLKNKGFKIVERNYQKKQGEIDIVAFKDKQFHFFEVKSVSVYSFRPDLLLAKNGGHSPEENVHDLKSRRLKKVIQMYMGNRVDVEFQFHVLCVFINQKTKIARVKWLKNIIL